jgi:dTDP-4-dehydrorhamnose reductase
MKIVLLGVTGMLGSQMLYEAQNRNLTVDVILRNDRLLKQHFPNIKDESIHLIDDIKDFGRLKLLIGEIKPDVVINCVGIVKQSTLASSAYDSALINVYLPHFLSDCASQNKFQFIHISTDCVFDGQKGNYNETDDSNASDLYGKSKFLGEVSNPYSVTLRTSIIGHEISKPTFGLLEWFLNSEGDIYGYTNAVFSGVTTNELAKIIYDVVIPQNLKGQVYQIASKAINKFELLKLIGYEYNKQLNIIPVDKPILDRSLNPSKFEEHTGYIVNQWPDMIKVMNRQFNKRLI